MTPMTLLQKLQILFLSGINDTVSMAPIQHDLVLLCIVKVALTPVQGKHQR